MSEQANPDVTKNAAEEVVTITPELEAEARTMGWRPQDEYKGNAQWVDADVFVERGKKNIPIMHQRLKQLEDKLESTQKAAQEFQTFAEKAAEARWKAHYDDLAQKRKQAVTEGDGEAFAEAEAALEEHRAAKPQPKAVTQNTAEQQTLQTWQTQNPWIQTNPKIAAYAIAHGQELKAQGLSLPEILQGMKDAAEEAFPDAFQKQAGPQRGGRTTAKVNGKSFENLPQDAKDAFYKFEKTGMIKDKKGPDGKIITAKQQYLNDYQWD